MPDQYHLPYGNAFIFNTPHLDQATNFLMRDQQLRRQQQDRENFMLDQQFNKEFANVRSADSDAVINSYNQYKQLKKQLLFNKNLQRDPQAYNKAQQAANEALANTYQTISRSSELKKQGEMMLQERKAHPERFSDNFGELMSTYNQTPINQLADHPYGDLSNLDTYLYKGSNTDFQKILNQSIGTAKPVFSFEEKVGDKGLQTKITPYSFGNTPAQVKDSLLGAMAQHNAGRDAEYLWSHLPQQEIESTIAQYKSIPQDKLQKMGLTDLQDLTPRNPQSAAENYASYLAMKYAISNEPKAGAPQYKTDVAAVEDYKFGHRKMMEQIRQGNREALQKGRQEYATAKEEKKTAMGNEYWDTLEEDAKKNPRIVFENGKTYTQHELKVSPESASILFPSKDKDGKYQQGDAVRLNPDGTVEGIIYERDDKGKIKKDDNGHNIIKTTSPKLLKSDYRIRLIKDVFGAKEAKAEEAKVQDETPPKVAPAKPSLRKGMFD